MFAPYQCLEIAGGFLIAATGNELHTFNLESGDQVSSWVCPAPVVESKASKKATQASEKVVLDITPDSEGTPEASNDNPPAKRRKISENGKQEVKEEEKAEESKRSKRPETKQFDGTVAPNFIALAVTKDARHVIGITGEDKHVRVFEHLNGVLNQISERSMAKRPCAVGITADDSLIITADKFGDVFSLPLQVPQPTEEPKPVEASPTSEEAKKFVSEANVLTVHSARNRRALENQLKQNLLKAEKSELNAGQTLLLGHVSMLTDIALIEREGRSYIITADRDEHIRVSRGIPQAHIIENYCFGHTDFVSKLCFPESAPHLMVSGGGDDDLYVWEWKSSKLLQRANLMPLVEKIIGSKEGEKTKIVVSGIKHLHAGGDLGSIAVTCEGVPAVFIFSLSSTSGLQFNAAQPLSGNALAMASVAQAGLIISIDTVHKPASTTELRGGEPLPVMPLEAFELGDRKIATSALRFKPAAEVSGLEGAKWSGLLYSLGNLRKRAGEE